MNDPAMGLMVFAVILGLVGMISILKEDFK